MGFIIVAMYLTHLQDGLTHQRLKRAQHGAYPKKPPPEPPLDLSSQGPHAGASDRDHFYGSR